VQYFDYLHFMTKKDLQKELLEKVKPGTKPSHLKRSKSANDIPKPPPLPKSEVEKLKQENSQLKTELQEAQTSKSQAQEKEKLASDQLTEKQKEVENLTRFLKLANSSALIISEPTDPSETNSEFTELDQSLIARHKSLKD